MPSRLLPPASCLLIALLSSSPPLLSQQLLVDAALSSGSFWRGVPRVSEWVLSPGATFALAAPGGHVSAGVRAVVELGGPDGGDYSVAGQRNVAELEYSLQYGGRLGAWDVTLGGMHYRLRAPDPFRTTEVYAALSLRESALRRVANLTPTLRAWYDVDRVRGAFVEADLTYAMPLVPMERPLGVVHLSLTPGWSIGQAREGGGDGYYDRNGLAYVAASVSVTGELWWRIGLGLSHHRSFGADGATRRRRPAPGSAERGSMGWTEVWLTYRLPQRIW